MSTMAMSSLKEDIKHLERLFLFKKTTASSSNAPCTSSSSTTTNNNCQQCCFRLISASADELVCELVDAAKKKYRINANICESYPHAPPVWFSESDEALITDIVEKLSATSRDEDNKIIHQVYMLITEFCRLKQMPAPDLTELLASPSSSSASASVTSYMVDSRSRVLLAINFLLTTV